MLLWLWYRPAAAAPVQPLTSELPYAMGVALKRQGEKKKKRKEDETDEPTGESSPTHSQDPTRNTRAEQR